MGKIEWEKMTDEIPRRERKRQAINTRLDEEFVDKIE